MSSNQFPEFAALIMAGGRSSRLGGTPKASLSNGHQTLLQTTLDAVHNANQRVVVGPADLPVPESVILTREDPPFSGPAAAITAGLHAISVPVNWICVLAVDMPRCADAVQALLQAAQQADTENTPVDGFFGVTAGIEQPLAGIYRHEALKRAFMTETANRSVRSFLRTLNLQPLELEPGTTDDVDTWESAHATGYDSAQWS